MSDWFWKKLSQLAGWLTLAVLFGLLILSANIEIKDVDLWLHLASGRYIVQQGAIPRVDVLSCTIAGAPWVNHEWLFQVIVYLAHHFFGVDGLIMVQVLVVGLTFFFLLFLGYDKDRQLVPTFTLLLVLLVYQMRLTHRPELFSLLFFVLYVYELALGLSQKSSRLKLFLIQVLWTNMHGFFILGPLLVCLNLAGEWIKRHVPLPFDWGQTGRLTDDEYKNLKWIFFLVGAACFVNPYFVKGALYPLGILFHSSGDSSLFFHYIQELQPPLGLHNLFDFHEHGGYKLLIGVSSLGFMINYRKLDIGAFLFWLAFLLLSLKAIRNVTFFAVAAYFVTLINVHSFSKPRWLPRWTDKTSFRCLVSIGLKGLLIFWMVMYVGRLYFRGYYDFDKHERKSEYGGVSLRNFPYKAVDFLVANGVEGNFFNDFNSGAYLLGRTHPQIKVFIDGRTEVYGADFFKNYKKICRGDQKLFNEAVEKHDLTGVFHSFLLQEPYSPFIKHLYDDPAWVLVYFDYDGVIFLKDIPLNKAWVDAFAIDLSGWSPPEPGLRQIGLTKVTPYRSYNRALALLGFGFFDKAREEARTALTIMPWHFKSRRLLGRIDLKRKDYAAAYADLRTAKLIRPSDLQTRYYLARALLSLGESQEAVQQCQLVLSRQPRNALAWYLLSLIRVKEGQYDDALDAFNRGFDLRTDIIDNMTEVTEALMDQGQNVLAGKLLARMKDANPEEKNILEQSRRYERLIKE